MPEFPRFLKPVTLWLVAGTLLFLAVQGWQARQRAVRFQVTDVAIELRRAPDGHFHWPGTVNGRPVEFLVDTGASRTALPPALAGDAPAIGSVRSATAAGVVHGEVVRVDLQLDGGVRVSQLPVTVLPDLTVPLLGMDVLSRLRFTQQGGVLRIESARSGD